MARQIHSKINVKGHYRTYYVVDGKGGYKSIKKWIPAHKRKHKKLIMITQKQNVKNRFPTQKLMVKQVPQNLIDAIKSLVKNTNHEYSIDLDFERHLETPEQMLFMKGGFSQTIKVGDFELFGHTHPNSKEPAPSNVDLKNLIPLKPEFIVARSGKAIIMNIEDFDTWQKFRTSDKLADTNYVGTEYGRERLLKQTGVKVYPFVKALKIEIVDDPRREKHFPRASSQYLSKWHSEDYGS